MERRGLLMKRAVSLVAAGAAVTLVAEAAANVWAVRRTAMRWLG